MSHPPAHPHGPIRQVHTDVWIVTGSFPIMPGVSIPRNMTIVREPAGTVGGGGSGRLVLFNSVRLTPAGEAELEALGRVTDVVRIGAYHGGDDPWYKERFGATIWAPAGIREPYCEYRTLAEGDSPLSDATPFVFRGGTTAEAAVIVARDGGILITCDAFQNWTTFGAVSWLLKPVMPLMGFGPAMIGAPWTRRMGPGIRGDFERLVELPFVHLLPGHGEPLRDRARVVLPDAMKVRFGP